MYWGSRLATLPSYMASTGCQRLVAGLDVTPEDLTRMGVRGMLKEMPGRPVSRDREQLDDLTDEVGPAIGGILLATGQSRRMGSANKMLSMSTAYQWSFTRPAMLDSNVSPVIVSAWTQSEQVENAKEMDLCFVRSPDYTDGPVHPSGADCLPARYLRWRCCRIGRHAWR